MCMCMCIYTYVCECVCVCVYMHMCVHVYVYVYVYGKVYVHACAHVFVYVCGYGVATTSRRLKIIGLLCRMSSLLYGSSAQETYDFKEPTNSSHPIPVCICIFSHDTAMYVYKI